MEQPFTTYYQELVSEIKSDISGLKAQAVALFKKANYDDVTDWYMAHALCQVALEENVFDETLEGLYKQIYNESWNYHCSIQFNDEDYAVWFMECKNLNDRIIAKGYERAYCEQYDLLDNARVGYKNEELANAYLMKGVAVDEPACLATYAYNLYYGIKGVEIADCETAKELMDLSTVLGYENAGLVALSMQYYGANSDEERWQAIQDHISVIEEQEKGLYIYSNYYLNKGEDQKTIDYLEKGITKGSAYCKYLFGYHILNRQFEGMDNARAISLLEEAFDYGIMFAGHALGYHYSYSREGDQDIDKAIYYFNRTKQYGMLESIFELALIHLYHPEKKDFDAGVNYLDQLVELEYPKALSEKAYVLLENPEVEKDVAVARILLDKAMALNNDYAPYRIGIGYQNAEFSEEADYKTALEYFEIAAARNNITAIEMAGRYYRYGYTGEPDPEKALEYYRKAIDLFNSDYSRIELAMSYEQGFGVKQNFETAKALYEEALENNYLYAAIRLAYLYEDDYLGEPNPTLSFEYFNKASEAGIAEAKYHVARFYRYGIGMEVNPPAAIQYFQEALDLGYVDAHVDLGLAYEEGFGDLAIDVQQALKHMTAAAEADIAYAQYKLGSYHSYGFLGEQDLGTAKSWYDKAYANGSALAGLALGDYYLYGYENTQEYDRAMEYYTFAEQHGYISEGIGICYEYELGVDKSLTEAFKYYKLAAERGYNEAVYRLATCYYYGKGTAIDKPEAFYYFKQVSEQNQVDAEYYMAMMLIKAEGIEQNIEEGMSYLMSAAEAGNNLAQYELGNAFLKGEGVVQDDDMAMEWYQKAAENGNEQALKLTGNSSRRRR